MIGVAHMLSPRNEHGTKPSTNEEPANRTLPDRSRITMEQVVRLRTRKLSVIIVLLATAAAVLVFINRGRAEGLSTHAQGPPAQSKAKKEKLRNFDAQILSNANELLED